MSMLPVSRSAEAPSDARPDPRPDARRELLRRVLRSPVFNKSERLSTLLTFVCELTLQGREMELNEQRIGEAVFGRAADYDSSVDGIVRTQASRLRGKLELYFSSEGAKEPVWIVIPRGGYVPIFEPRSLPRGERNPLQTIPVGSAPTMAPALDPERWESADTADSAIAPGLAAAPGGIERLAPPATPSTILRRLPWLLVGLLSLGLLTVLWRQNHLAEPQYPVPDPFWKQIFAENQRTLIVEGDSGLVMWQNLMGRDVRLAEYLSGDYRIKQPSKAAGDPKVADTLGSVAADMGARRYTSSVDLDVVKALDTIAESLKNTPTVRYSRDVRPNDLKQGNVVLLGTYESTPWVELFEPSMNFYFQNERIHHVFSVLNRAPQGNEPRQWDSSLADRQHRVYAVVAYLPNLAGQGNALILEGTSMAGTESAWDFVSDHAQLQPFLNRIRKPDGSIPHFEVVLGNNNMNGSAGKNVVLAWRTTH